MTIKHKFNELHTYHLPKNTSDEELYVYSCFYKEIFNDNEYDRYGISVEENDIVLDAGANVGLFTNYALSKNAGRILSIECDKTKYDCMVKNTHNTKVQQLNGFVSGNEMNDSQSYSLSDIIKIFNVESIDFAKIDIEGYEYDFILNASDEDISRVNKWAIEVHYVFDAECAQRVLNILDKFSKNNYLGYYTRIHLNTNLAMLYFKKR